MLLLAAVPDLYMGPVDPWVRSDWVELGQKIYKYWLVGSGHEFRGSGLVGSKFWTGMQFYELYIPGHLGAINSAQVYVTFV